MVVLAYSVRANHAMSMSYITVLYYQYFPRTGLTKHWWALSNRTPRNAHRARKSRADSARSRHMTERCRFVGVGVRADCGRSPRDFCVRDVHCAACG